MPLLLLAGGMLTSSQEFDAAEGMFRRALELDPNNMNACSLLGHMVTQQGRLAKATAEFERVLSSRPSLCAGPDDVVRVSRSRRK